MQRREMLITGALAAAYMLTPVVAISQATAERVRITKDRISSKNRSYNYKKLADPTGKAPTKRVERFELRGGDCSGQGDCTPRPLNGRQVSRARTERVLFTDLKNGDAGLLSYYIYFPSKEYNVVNELGSTFGQLLASLTRSWESDSRPIFSLDTDEGSRPSLHAQVVEAEPFEGRRANEKTLRVGTLDRGSSLFYQWIKIEAHFLLSESNNGFVEIRVNGKSIGRFVGKTILPEGGIEIRYGIYQTGTNQYPGGANAIPSQVVYFADVQVLRIVG
jgi:hypothetical protein